MQGWSQFERVGDSRNLGALGRTDAVPVEVGPERDQPDHPGRAGERGLDPRNGFGWWFRCAFFTLFGFQTLCCTSTVG